MTPAQIVIEVAIGVALIIVGVFAREPLERFKEYLKRPAPLTPATRGQWTQYVAMLEQSLERIDHLNSHPRDLYLYLLQMMFASLLADGLALFIFAWIYAAPPNPSHIKDISFAFALVMLLLGIVICIVGIFEGKRFSQRQINVTRKKLQKKIDQYKIMLAGPDSEA
jgi:hypothetical protein